MENNAPALQSDPPTSQLASESFLDLPLRGKNNWWRYVLTIFLVLIAWQLVGVIPYAFMIAFGVAQNTTLSFIAINFSFICLISTLFLCIYHVHRRKPLTLITTDSKISFKQICISGGLWFLVVIVTTLLDALIHPGSYKLTFNFNSWIIFLPAALILTPIQAGAEELLFRGYFLQGLGFLTKRKWLLVVISGVIFAVPHFLNPEMKQGFVLLALYYFSFGAALTIFTLKSNRLEYAIGIHGVNNLATVLLANYTDSALPSPSIFTASIPDPVYNLISFLIGIAIVWLLLFNIGNKNKPAEE